MEQSILTSIKKLLGPTKEDTNFDLDIMMAINTSFLALTQIGIGPVAGFQIFDAGSEWDEFIGSRQDLESVKSYVYLKTRLIFDPPQSGFTIEAIKDQIKEIEWRLSVQAGG